ncbi:hypothetical protein BJ165DRAFT_839215 [Panaeolus papilionaceus]|nr:hypothetical protein BJ165DRAFT_839215 [Panaeolus papilionaceus]
MRLSTQKYEGPSQTSWACSRCRPQASASRTVIRPRQRNSTHGMGFGMLLHITFKHSGMCILMHTLPSHTQWRTSIRINSDIYICAFHAHSIALETATRPTSPPPSRQVKSTQEKARNRGHSVREFHQRVNPNSVAFNSIAVIYIITRCLPYATSQCKIIPTILQAIAS